MQLTIGTTATFIDGIPPGNSLIIQNLGAYDMYVGSTPTVTTSTGIRVSPGGNMIISGPFNDVSVYLIADSSRDVRWDVF